MVALIGASAAGLVPAARADAQALPGRDDYVFVVHVDSKRGDNRLAWAQNPGTGPGTPVPLSIHPDVTTTPKPVQGLLQQTPYAFQTLTQQSHTGDPGALAYINTVFPTLPWTHPVNGKTVHWVVIMVEPGLYGPRMQGAPDIDPRSGLPFNGETFPAVLRDRVSIQGTSALDTIFDARHTATSIVTVGSASGGDTHLDSFIDGITVRGARSDGQPQPSTVNQPNTTGAGIYIGREGNVRVTVSNTFITDNVVGIAIDSDVETEEFRNRPQIINNTIAWNAVGVWQGNTGYNYVAPNRTLGGRCRCI